MREIKWEIISQDSRFIYYRKGDRYNNISASFDLELKQIYITESYFVRNDEPMLEPQSEWIAHSAKYGHTQISCPTLGIDDMEFIYRKAMELFKKESEDKGNE